MQERRYIAIDLKSFYASVECVERRLDPLNARLVVADESRTDKTICLAVSPALKAYGTGGRPRLFEVKQRVPRGVDFIIAPPRMALYLKYSRRINKIYQQYIAPEDIHVYSVDEVFIDATPYLSTYKTTAHQLAQTIIRDVLRQTGITATAGIGPNLYLCKVAMDIVAKHIPADSDGVRIAELDEMSYRRQLWSHTPLTDFWRVGRGIQRRLEPFGIKTMGDIARLSMQNEDFLYSLFGVNAELLIDHAWGWEPCTIEMIKAYRPSTNSISSGQVLSRPYTTTQALVVVKEMAEALAMSLLGKHLVARELTLTIGYDTIIDTEYNGEMHIDRYGRRVPKHSHGTARFDRHTSSSQTIRSKAEEMFLRIANADLYVRRLNLAVCHVVPEEQAQGTAVQLDLFADPKAEQRQHQSEERERKLMQATLDLKRRFGQNSVLKGLDFDEGATTRERNQQIGGHKA